MTCAIDVIENLSTLRKLDFPGSQHDCKEGTLDGVFQKEEIKTSSTNDRARQLMTEMAEET